MTEKNLLTALAAMVTEQRNPNSGAMDTLSQKCSPFFLWLMHCPFHILPLRILCLAVVYSSCPLQCDANTAEDLPMTSISA